MRSLFVILLFVSTYSYSQNKSIDIVLRNGSKITTDWIKLNDSPLFQDPYIKIHSVDGPKIRIKDIMNYKGYDRLGNYRQLDVIDLEFQSNYNFLERKFILDSTEYVKIFNDQLIYGLNENPGKVKQIKYSINSSPTKKLSYKNVRNELGDLSISDNNLKQANQIRIIQLLSFGIGAVLLADVLNNNYNPTNPDFMNREGSIKLLSSGVLLTSPLSLQRVKNKKLINALRNYK